MRAQNTDGAVRVSGSYRVVRRSRTRRLPRWSRSAVGRSQRDTGTYRPIYVRVAPHTVDRKYVCVPCLCTTVVVVVRVYARRCRDETTDPTGLYCRVGGLLSANAAFCERETKTHGEADRERERERER